MSAPHMSESFVDVTYRGLSLARRARLSQVRPSTAYVEAPQPMPVGTTVALITDDTVALEATVLTVREQVAGSEGVPGMLVRPRLEGEAAQAWWRSRVTLPDIESTPSSVGRAGDASPMVVVARRMTNPGMGVPVIVADAHDTGVMDAVDPAVLAAAEVSAGDSGSRIVDDGKATTAMDAVDLAALGLDNGGSGADDDDSSDGDGAKPDAKPGARKRRKKR